MRADSGWICGRGGLLAEEQRGTRWDLPRSFNPEPRSQARRDGPAASSARRGEGQGKPKALLYVAAGKPSSPAKPLMAERPLCAQHAAEGSPRCFSPSAPQEESVLLSPNAARHGERGCHRCRAQLVLPPPTSGPEPSVARRDGRTAGSPGKEPRRRKASYRLPPRWRSSGCWVGRPLCPGGRSLPGSPVLPPLVASPRLSGPPRPGAGCPHRPPALGWFHGWT